MDETINRAIVVLGGKITQSVMPEAAVKLTQSMLNLAYTKQKLAEVGQEAKPTRAAK